MLDYALKLTALYLALVISIDNLVPHHMLNSVTYFNSSVQLEHV